VSLRLLLDEGISPFLIRPLAALDVFAESVAQVGLSGQTDGAILSYAIDHEMALVTANAQDFVGMHAYLYDGGNFSSSPAGITLTISELEALMTTYGISDKSIWFTEGNWGYGNNTSMTGSQKAAYVAQEYLLMWSSGKVARYYWYAWDNTALGTLWDSTTGINTAGVAYGRLTDWLVGSVHQDQPCSESADGTWTCNLTLASGYPGEIIWNASAAKTITVSAAYATYETLADSTVHSIVGNKVAIGNEPVLLVGSQAGQ